MKKWSIVGFLGIALLAICLGSVVASLPVLRQIWSGRIQWNAFSMRNISADVVEEQRVDVDGPADLTVYTSFGKVEVVAVADSREIVISAHKYAWGGNQQAAENLLEKVKIIVEQHGDSVTVYVDQPVSVSILQIGPATAQVDFAIRVPIDCAVEASSASGDVRLEGTNAEATLHSSFGKVTAENIQGGLSAETSSGEVVVKNIQAGGKSVKAISSFGDVFVQNAEGEDLIAKTNSGEVTVEDSTFSAEADISSSFGDVLVTALKARTVNAQTGSGKVSLQDLEIHGDLVARSDMGDVEVKNSSAESYDLFSNSGTVTAEDTQGRVKAHSGFGDVEIQGTEVILNLSANSGSIEFTGSLGLGTSILHTEFGDIRILLPSDAEFQYDLSTNFGDVQCDFATDANQEDATHQTGTVGAGGPMLNASTNSGSVSVYSQTPE